MNVKKILKEAYDEVMKELELSSPKTTPTQDDIELGDLSARLAQYKGELATLLDKATRAGYITRDKNGKIVIKNKVAYMKILGDLPEKIKLLQKELEPSLTKP
jgi:hypothetical protein